MSEILINERTYSYSAIREGNYNPEIQAEKEVLNFMKAWLNGQMEFTIFTSGSTGAPKSITVSRSQMSLSAKKTGLFLNLKKGDTALICLSPEHIAGKMMLVRSLVLELKTLHI